MPTNAEQTSARASKPPNLRNRLSKRTVGYQIANLDPPKCLISSKYCPALQEDTLEDIADVLSKIERRYLFIVKQSMEHVMSGRLNAGDTAARLVALHDLEDITELLEQFDHVSSGIYRFHEHYLQDRYLIRYWQKGGSLWSQYLDIDTDQDFQKDIMTAVGAVEQCALPLPDLLDRAALEQVLTHDMRAAIRDKYSRLQQLVDYLHSKDGSERKLLPWSTINSRLRAISEKTGASSTKKGEASRPVKTSKVALAIMWLTFGSTTLASIPTLVVAFKACSAVRGTVNDADFWFLLQTAIMQCSSLLIAIMSMKKGELSGHSWVWTITWMTLALACAVTGPVVYIKWAVGWGALFIALAGIVQAFVILQVTLVEGSG